MFYSYVDSPIGQLVLTGDAKQITALHLPEAKRAPTVPADAERNDAVLQYATRQLNEYFAGKRREFQLRLNASGTDFQRRVWDAVYAIPYGTTASYRDIAEAVGSPKAVRAVGMANGRNPIPLIVPCHRIVGADGSLTGYGGGLPTKRWLLDHEQGTRLPALF